MKKTMVLHKNPEMVTRVLGDETLLLPIYKRADEIKCIYSLNKVASEVWKMINSKRILSEIKKLILKKFDTTKKEVDKEMQKFLKDLRRIKAIK